jgi:hypothetical protein
MTREDYAKYWQGKTFKAHTPAFPKPSEAVGEGKGDWIQCQSCKLSMTAFDAYFKSRSTE